MLRLVEILNEQSVSPHPTHTSALFTQFVSLRRRVMADVFLALYLKKTILLITGPSVPSCVHVLTKSSLPSSAVSCECGGGGGVCS